MASVPRMLTIGSCVRDLIIHTRDGYLAKGDGILRRQVLGFEVGAKISAASIVDSCGGGAANAAITFSRAGFVTSIFSALGDDSQGIACRNDLMKDRVIIAELTHERGVSTGRSVIIHDTSSQKHFIIVHRGASETLRISTKKLTRANPRALYLTALSGGYTLDTIRAIDTYVRRTGIFFAWNPGAQQFKKSAEELRPYLRHARVLLVNHDEALGLIQNTKKKITSAAAACAYLHRFGQAITVVTAGHKGAHAFDGKKMYFQRAFTVKAINKTGAGDAFGSAFVVGLHRYQFNIQRAMRLGAHNAASVVTRVGAQAGILKKYAS